MHTRGCPPESNAHGSGDEGKTQNDRRMLRREHVILARMSSQGEQVPDQFRGGEENRVSYGFTAREIPCVHEQLYHLSGRARGVYHMSGVRCHSIQEVEESSSKIGVVLSDHSSSAVVFRGSYGSKAPALAR